MIEQKSQQRQGDTMAQMVFVASADLLTAWTSRTVSDGRLTTFSDADLEGAVEAIFRGRPNMVVVEHRVAATAHGPEFIRRLQTDPGLAGLDIRVIDAETITSLIESPELARQAPELLAERAEQLPVATRRRMPRFKVPHGVALVVDGSAAMLVDVSTMGAQVFSLRDFATKATSARDLRGRGGRERSQTQRRDRVVCPRVAEIRYGADLLRYGSTATGDGG